MKRIILGMSVTKDKLEDRMTSLSDKVTIHLLKCTVYRNETSNYEHWITEISNWLSLVNDMTAKPNNKKLKPKSYEITLFGGIGRDAADSRLNLEWWLAEVQKTHKYPEFVIDADLIVRFQNVCKDVLDTFIPILSSKNDLQLEDIKQTVHTILDKYCLQG